MKKTTRNEVKFSEIFEYAEEHFNIDWNTANDVFFHHVFEYGKHDTVYIETLIENIEFCIDTEKVDLTTDQMEIILQNIEDEVKIDPELFKDFKFRYSDEERKKNGYKKYNYNHKDFIGYVTMYNFMTDNQVNEVFVVSN